MRRSLAILATLVLLWTGVSLVNDGLAPAHLSVFAGGLFVLFPALAMTLPEGLAATVLAGAVCDANAPVPFGTHVVLFSAAHAVLFASRDRVPHDLAAGRLWIALAANAVLFAALTAVFSRLRGLPANPWGALAADLACSEALVALAAGWFFALQGKALALVPSEPDLML
jgi:rod shape-determining protein MreD